MPTREHLAGQWREWRHARIATLTRPYGWLSLVSQQWLRESDRDVALDMLPGTWGVDGGRVMYTPPARGANLSVGGSYPSGPVEIVPGRNQTYGHGDSVPVYFGRLEVETIVRTDHEGGAIYAVRVRDPHESAAKDLSGLEAFDYDLTWRVAAHFEPAGHVDVEAATVEPGVRETTTTIGTLELELSGSPFALTVLGKDSASGVKPVLHLRDVTNGDTTYGAGRVVDLQWVVGDAHPRVDVVDFNYLVALPCAFTNYVTCPIPPPENRLDIAVTAGEKRPAIAIDRARTYQT